MDPAQQGVRTRTQKRKNLARKGVEILQRVGVSRDYGVQLLDTMKQEGINIQPGIVLENPVFNPGQTLLFGQYGKYFKEVISGKRLVTDKMVPLNLNDVQGEKLTISGKPILNPHLTARIKDNYNIETDKISEIPIYFIVNANRGAHLSLLVLLNNIVYSLSGGLSEEFYVDLDDNDQPVLMPKRGAPPQFRNEGDFLKKSRAQQYEYLDREEAFFDTIQAVEVPKSGVRSPLELLALPQKSVEDKKAEASGHAVRATGIAELIAATFYSPDTLVKPQATTSQGKVYSHKIYDMGFLKTKHLERINAFLAKSAKTHDIQLGNKKILKYVEEDLGPRIETARRRAVDAAGGPGRPEAIEEGRIVAETMWGEFEQYVNSNAKALERGKFSFLGLTILTYMKYTLLSNELDVAKNKDYINCTSFLASVFLERINCVGNFSVTADILREAYKLNESAAKASLELAVSTVLGISNPKTCKTIGYYGQEIGSDPYKMFSEFETWWLSVKAKKTQEHNIPPYIFNALNNTPAARPAAFGLGIRDSLDRAGLHSIAKFGNSVAAKLGLGPKRGRKTRRSKMVRSQSF